MATKMIILDTNIVVDYLRQKPIVVAFIDRCGKANLALPPIVLMEVYQGVLDKQDLERTRKKLKGFAKIGHSQEVAELGLQLQQTYILSHHIGIPDTLIAATALVYDLELRTYNLKDFGFIPGIKVSNALD
jgi:predicted nucleic acid-binding protein